MKHLSSLTKFSLVCGMLTTAAVVTSCQSPLPTPLRAAQRLEHSPVVSVFSHNDVNSPRLRDVDQAGPMPERAYRALVTWLHNSTVRDFSYVYPQYYITTENPQGGGETVWGLCSDGRGNLVGVLVPTSKRTPAWDLPTIGGYKVLVCETPEREALSKAIMDSLADAGYDHVRIATRMAGGLTDKAYLLSKPLDEEAERQLERERRERERAVAELKKKAQENAAAVGAGKADAADDKADSSADTDDSKDDDDDAKDNDTDDDTDTKADDEDSDSKGDDEDTSDSSDDDSSDSSSDDEDTDSDDD